MAGSSIVLPSVRIANPRIALRLAPPSPRPTRGRTSERGGVIRPSSPRPHSALHLLLSALLCTEIVSANPDDRRSLQSAPRRDSRLHRSTDPVDNFDASHSSQAGFFPSLIEPRNKERQLCLECRISLYRTNFGPATGVKELIFAKCTMSGRPTLPAPKATATQYSCISESRADELCSGHTSYWICNKSPWVGETWCLAHVAKRRLTSAHLSPTAEFAQYHLQSAHPQPRQSAMNSGTNLFEVPLSTRNRIRS